MAIAVWHTVIQTPHILISIRIPHFPISCFDPFAPLSLILLPILLHQPPIPIKQVILELCIYYNSFNLEGKSTVSMFLSISPFALVDPPIKVCHLPKPIPQSILVLSLVSLSTCVPVHPITMLFVFQVASPINVAICTLKAPFSVLSVGFELPRVLISIRKHVGSSTPVLIVFPFPQIAISIAEPMNPITLSLLTILRLEFTPVGAAITKPLNLNTALQPSTSLSHMTNLKLLG